MFLKEKNYPALIIGFLFLVFFVHICSEAYSQVQNKKTGNVPQKETYTRPAPSRPIKPEIPGANRYQHDKIFLEYADSLYKVATFDTIEKQILKGNVKFRQAGMWMYCDSAYYYPQLNSLDAFSHVKMEQGDTLFVYADKLFYTGDNRLAKLLNGPTEPKVRLINRDVTLTTDSLDYDLAQEKGWYSRWGVIDDKVNTLTSLEGIYYPKTKDSEFFTDVVLVNNRDGYTLLTDTLLYNTSTHIAKIESLATIQSENDTIITRRAIYETDLGNATLLSRSTIIHRDSTGNVVTLEGDSIIYDKASRISRAYMFKDPLKSSMPMVLTDTAQKTTLIGGFGIYNDSTREAMAYIYPLFMEYSRGDTLFLRADTIKTYIVTEMVPDPSLRKVEVPLYNGNPLVTIDSTGIHLDDEFFLVTVPLENYPLELLEKNAPKNPVADTNLLNKLEFVQADEIIIDKDISNGDDTIPEDDEMIETVAGVFPEINTETIPDSISKVKEDSIPLIPKDFHVAMAYYNGRFFKKDIQGVADSLLFIEHDSILYMFRKPIVWSGERQVTGNRIDVHFNDSTVDWTRLPDMGMLSEYVDEDFYNQIAGRDLLAHFEEEELRSLNVSGNVETIFLPQESDSTFNRLVAAESSYLSLEMKDGKMEKLKMWPEVNGTVTPIFLVKKSQQYLRNFHWWDFLRPQRSWYGGTVVWDDELGEVPEVLEAYFKSPSDFGEPKTFSPTRFVPPTSSIKDWDEQEATDNSSQIPEVTLDELKENEDDLEDAEQAALRQNEEILQAVGEEETSDDESEDEISETEGTSMKEIHSEGNEEFTEEEGEQENEEEEEAEEEFEDEEPTIVVEEEWEDEEPTIVVEGEEEDY